jgi:hypothetical protein
MSESPVAPDSFDSYEAFRATFPDIAAQVEDQVKTHVQAAETALGAKQGESKKIFATEAAEQTFTAAAQGVYDAVDFFAGFPGPIDALVKQVVLPALPDLIDGAVAWFHSTGLFAKVD